MIEKKDWIVAKKTFETLKEAQENQIVNAEVNLELYKILTPYIESMIAKFPKEDEDPMPQEVKDLVKDIK